MNAGARPALARWVLERPASVVAPDLLGCLLQTEGILARIVEVEAYEQSEPAAHTFRGPTPGNATMFCPAGRLYTYFTYGMHWCANVVTGSAGQGEAVLLRAARLLEGEQVARARRGARPSDRDLLRGPARLAQALGLDGDADGTDLLADDAPLRLLPRDADPSAISTGPRVGVRLAADLAWRFWVTDDPLVSAYKRHPKAAPTPPRPPARSGPPSSLPAELRDPGLGRGRSAQAG
ncbi:DNA-3-methyladenine glycosylase [soil metagenome]